jgi:Fe-S-cluster containining protein
MHITELTREKGRYRLSFGEDEHRFRWLPMLLDAYALCDAGIVKAIAREVKKHGRVLACARGCGACCRIHKDIPVYPIELMGIYWYVTERLQQPLRSIVKNQLISHRKTGACPFLVDNVCAIHCMRPMACRQFNVFSHPCGDHEDPYHTRRHDVLIPLETYTEAALACTLPFYGIEATALQKKGLSARVLNAQVRILQTCPWENLALLMDNAVFGDSKENAQERTTP